MSENKKNKSRLKRKNTVFRKIKKDNSIEVKKNDQTEIEKYFGNIWTNDSKEKIKIMIKDTIDVFTKNNDTIFLFYGSLLGCVRCGKILPWDGDVDFFVSYQNQPFKSFDDLQSMGYKLHGSPDSYRRIFREDGLANTRGWTWPWIDFYIYEIKDDKVNFLIDKNKIFYSSDAKDVFPLQKKLFEDVEVNVPFVIDKHLDAIYPDWQNTCESPKINHRIARGYKKMIRVPSKKVNF